MSRLTLASIVTQNNVDMARHALTGISSKVHFYGKINSPVRLGKTVTGNEKCKKTVSS